MKEEDDDDIPGPSQDENTDDEDEDSDIMEAACEAVEFDYQECETHLPLNVQDGRVSGVEEFDVMADWIEKANTKLPEDYGRHIWNGEFKEAANSVVIFKEKWFQKDNLMRKEKIWEAFLTSLSSVLEMDYFYYALEFTKMFSKIIGTKNKNIIRQKYTEIQTVLASATRETGRPHQKRETRRSQSVEFPIMSPTSQEFKMYLRLKEYVDYRVKMIDLYITTFQFYERYLEWDNFLERVMGYSNLFEKETAPILKPAFDYFKEELRILKDLISVHQNIAKMKDTMMSLVELTKIRNAIITWAKGFEMPENSPLPIIGRLQKTELAPKFHTALWFLKFYDFLTAKISLYITDHMRPFISAEDLSVMHAQDNMYNFISLFKTLSKECRPTLLAVVLDRTEFLHEPFYGFNRPHQHRLYSSTRYPPLEGLAASHPYVFKVEWYALPENSTGQRNASGSMGEHCHSDVAFAVNRTRDHFKANPISSMNPKPRQFVATEGTKDLERKVFVDHIEENLFVVAVFHMTYFNAPNDFEAFTNILLPSLNGKNLFAEMRKLLSP